jgi:hypothetical protein
MSVKPRYLLLLFYKISITIYAFLPALQNLNMYLRCGRSSFQLLATSFARLPGQPRQSHSGDLLGDLSRNRISGSLRDPNPDCRVDGRAVPSRFVFLCKQTRNQREQICRYPKISIIWTVWCPTPSCDTVSLTVILR